MKEELNLLKNRTASMAMSSSATLASKVKDGVDQLAEATTAAASSTTKKKVQSSTTPPTTAAADESSQQPTPKGPSYPQIGERLHVLYDPATKKLPTNVDIVFLHGLQSNEFRAWTTGNGLLWPAVFLPQDFPHCRIITAGYGSEVSEWQGPTKEASLETAAASMMHRLLSAGLGGRKLVFVAHSLGGLLVKSLLMELYLSMSDAGVQMLEQVQGVVFYSTPHRGSSLASYASAIDTILGRAMKLSGVVKEMGKGSSLNTLNTNFLRLVEKRNIPLLAFGERLKTSNLVNVVDINSANPAPDSAKHEFHIIDADHYDVCVPDSKTADAYRYLHKYLVKVVGAEAGSPLDRTVAPSVVSASPEMDDTCSPRKRSEQALQRRLSNTELCCAAEQLLEHSQTQLKPSLAHSLSEFVHRVDSGKLLVTSSDGCFETIDVMSRGQLLRELKEALSSMDLQRAAPPPPPSMDAAGEKALLEQHPTPSDALESTLRSVLNNQDGVRALAMKGLPPVWSAVLGCFTNNTTKPLLEPLLWQFIGGDWGAAHEAFSTLLGSPSPANNTSILQCLGHVGRAQVFLKGTRNTEKASQCLDAAELHYNKVATSVEGEGAGAVQQCVLMALLGATRVEVLLHRRQLEAATKAADAAFQHLHPETPLLMREHMMLLYAECLVRQGQLVAAEQCIVGMYRNSTHITTLSEGYTKLGYIHHQRGHHDVAQVYYTNALKLAPDNTFAATAMGWLLLKRYTQEQAKPDAMTTSASRRQLRQLASSAQLHLAHANLSRPHKGWALCGLGRYHEIVRGDSNLAEEMYSCAFDINPSCSWAAQYLGDIALRERQHQKEAEVWYRRALASDGRNSWPAASLGRLCQEKDRHGEAAKLFSQALESDPNNLWALQGLVRHHEGITKDAAKAATFKDTIRRLMMRR